MTRRYVELDLASTLKVVDAIQMAAEAFAIAEGLDADSSHFLAVALRESTVNAIAHGNGEDKEKRVAIRLKSDGRGKLVYEVKDVGAGFDPKQLPDPLDPENVRRGSGRGVFYMKKFSDRVRFRFPSSGGTVVELEKALEGRKTRTHRRNPKHK